MSSDCSKAIAAAWFEGRGLNGCDWNLGLESLS